MMETENAEMPKLNVAQAKKLKALKAHVDKIAEFHETWGAYAYLDPATNQYVTRLRKLESMSLNDQKRIEKRLQLQRQNDLGKEN